LVLGLKVRVGVETVKVSVEGGIEGLLEAVTRLPQGVQQLERAFQESEAKLKKMGRLSHQDAVDYLIKAIRREFFSHAPRQEVRRPAKKRRSNRRDSTGATPRQPAGSNEAPS
jgi:hypothetical protein